MTPTFVIVPVKNEWHLTESFLDCMDYQQGWHDLLVLDNGSTDGSLWRARERKRFAGENMHVWDQTGLTIYEMWSNGFARAKRRAKGAPFNVLVCNNDIQLPLHAVEDMAYWLRAPGRSDAFVVYPDYDEENWEADRTDQATRETHGVFGDGGMFGPCFMLRGEAIHWAPLITDPTYQWWYGDNHLAECIELAGGTQIRVVGLPVKHVNEGTAQHYPELYAKKLYDRGQWITRHQRGYGVAP